MEKEKKSILPGLIKFMLGLISGGITISIVYQSGLINVNGNNNTINYYTVYQGDTTLDWETTTIQSKDKKGRKVEFVIAILSQEKRWKFGSSDSLENHLSFDEFFPRYLKSLRTFDSSKEIIAIGVASQEGNTLDEFNRADRRADKILEILRPLSSDKNLYKLNLGKHIEVNSDKETSWQRRIIIGAIKSRDNSMGFEDIKFALFEGLKNQMKMKLGFEINEYNDFKFTNPN